VYHGLSYRARHFGAKQLVNLPFRLLERPFNVGVREHSEARIYDAIENGVADLADPMLKDRVAELKAVRDQARADAERAEGALERLGPSITPQALKTFARTARKRMRTESGGYRRDHLRSASKSTRRNSHHGVEERAPAYARRRFKRKNGGFWRAQLCTEVARHWRFER
jgi:hypothetical protein